ncbi:ecotin family protein [Chryseobacterium sp.]|uniref:ecotin family protein n=1 Tax=Chryseobacterium sp. TaxID=1871047 RepID=UPI0025C204E8|nr:ecotin family protein [Chryseobacterium sp.]
MMKILKTVVASVLLLGANAYYAQTKNNGSVKLVESGNYPRVPEGYKRMLIKLPAVQNEKDLRIEILIGKNINADVCNEFGMEGSIQLEETFDKKGIVYEHYKAKDVNVIQTLMLCGDNKKVKKFVSIGKTIYYSSKLPIAIDVPKDMEVSYKILRVDKEVKVTEKF